MTVVDLDGRIGEGWSGVRPNDAHVNVVLARRGSPTVAAAIGMLAHPFPGHTPVLVCVGQTQAEYEPVWPPTLMMNKATAVDDRHQTITWGAAQLGIGQGVLDLRSMKKLSGIAGKEAARRLEDLMARVRLTERTPTQKPVQLSGGLKQRVAIARAFAGDPRLVVCDEPTSALDVSVQAAILNLLVELQAEKRVAYIFISHDLGVVRYISDRIGVLYLGRLQELGPADVVFGGPHHPYTEALLSAVPTVDGGGRDRIRLEGDIPSAAEPPSGCVFHTRCPRKLGAICEEEEPPLLEVENSHLMRCHIPLETLRQVQNKEEARV